MQWSDTNLDPKLVYSHIGRRSCFCWVDLSMVVTSMSCEYSNRNFMDSSKSFWQGQSTFAEGNTGNFPRGKLSRWELSWAKYPRNLLREIFRVKSVREPRLTYHLLCLNETPCLHLPREWPNNICHLVRLCLLSPFLRIQVLNRDMTEPTRNTRWALQPKKYPKMRKKWVKLKISWHRVMLTQIGLI